MTKNDKNTAILPAEYVSNGHNYSGEKEMVGAWSAVVLDGGKMRDLVTVRTYMGRARGSSRVYASIWAPVGSGHGHAGGYGYHKASAAIQAAIDSAGIKLSCAIDGVGETAIRDALIAICEAQGFSDVLVVTH